MFPTNFAGSIQYDDLCPPLTGCKWGSEQFCPNGGHAVDFSLKIEPNQNCADDTGLNAICLHCSEGAETICSSEGRWGLWHHDLGKCQGGFTAANILFEPDQKTGDDTAANDLKLKCRDDGEWKFGKNLGGWGEWRSVGDCPEKSVICGLQTRIQKDQKRDDDTALNGVTFLCCRI